MLRYLPNARDDVSHPYVMEFTIINAPCCRLLVGHRVENAECIRVLDTAIGAPCNMMIQLIAFADSSFSKPPFSWPPVTPSLNLYAVCMRADGTVIIGIPLYSFTRLLNLARLEVADIEHMLYAASFTQNSARRQVGIAITNCKLSPTTS